MRQIPSPDDPDQVLSVEPFAWHPGVGVDAAALARLRSRFRRPRKPMGEAWFMGEERRLFHDLEGDLDALSVQQLQQPLHEIASGTSSFGPYGEWHEWYHYLLGRLIPRSHESFVSSLLESLVTAFVALYPNGIHRAPYPEFQSDVLLTLGRCMMEPQCWHEGEIVVGRSLHRSNDNPTQLWGWWDASGDFSASLFFCLKYLPLPLVRGWFRSVLEIESPHWRAQLLVWLVGANELLYDPLRWPSQLADEAHPSINWEWSHCLMPELAGSDDSGAPAVASFLPDAARALVLEAIHAHFTEDVFLQWLESIASVPYLEGELAAIPSTFEGMYVHRREA